MITLYLLTKTVTKSSFGNPPCSRSNRRRLAEQPGRAERPDARRGMPEFARCGMALLRIARCCTAETKLADATIDSKSRLAEQ